MCAASPTLEDFPGLLWGPSVTARHRGFEHRHPARPAITHFTFCGNSSRIVAARREHYLNTTKRAPGAQNENSVIPIAKTRLTKTPCCLLSIESRLPKLDVAGSTPVSRSIFSWVYEQ
jgi:hypothetical protein